MKGTLYLLFALLATASGLSGQIPSGGSAGLGIERFGIEDGLPGLAIQDLEVTADGRLWVVASGRLVAFDGLVFEEHLRYAELAWHSGRIGSIGAGRGDTLWVNAEHLFSYVDGRVALRAETEYALRDVWQDRDGQIWIWDLHGALSLDGDRLERRLRLPARWTWGVVAVEPGDPAGAREGRALLDRGRGKIRRIASAALLDTLTLPEGWPLPEEGMIRERRTSEGVEFSDPSAGWVITVPNGSEGTPLTMDRRGLFWIAFPGRVDALGPDGDVVASLPVRADVVFNAVHEDGEGNLWLGTASDGLYRIGPRPVRVFAAAEGVTDEQVFRVYEGGHGVLTVDRPGRIVRLSEDGAEVLFDPISGESRATAALLDRGGTLWVSLTEGNGFRLLRRTSGGVETRFPSPLQVHLIREGSEPGVFWLGGGNLFRMSLDAAGFPRFEGPLLEGRWTVRDMALDGEGGLWVGGPAGVAQVTTGGVRTFEAEDGYPTADARAVHLDSDGTLWIGRYGTGLVRYRDGRFGVVRPEDGLWDGIVSSIVEDDSENLWMGSNRGIHRVARSDLNAFLDGEVERVRGRGYGAGDGFRNPEASGWPAHRSDDGRLWFPTFSGVAVIDPDEALERERVPPGVRLVGIRAGGELVGEDSRVLELPRGQRRFDVLYGAIALSGHEGMRYEVHLDGVDDGWIDVGGQRQVSYANVPPGRRILRVRAVNGAGVKSADEATITLVVPPYFTETPAFIVLVSLFGAALLWGAYRLRVRRLQAREAVLEGLVRERTHDLARSRDETERALETVEAQAAELRSLDEAKSRFFANVSHELRTPLTLVQGPLQDVLDGRLGPTSEAVRDQVEVVLASGRRLGDLVEQLLDVARLEAGELRLALSEQDIRPLLERIVSSFAVLARSRGIELEAALPPTDIHARVDADRMEKVWTNLLSNAVKFSPEGGRVRFEVEVTGEGDHAELVTTVEDDGPGIAEGEQARIFERFHQVDGSARRVHGGTGLGLALVRELTELHGGTVELSSEPNEGSCFTVRIPRWGRGDDASSEGPGSATDRYETEGGSAMGDAVPGHRIPSPDSEGSPPDSEVDSDGVPPDFRRPTVVIVEDHDELRSYLRRHLEDDYRVLEARNGREGLELARRVVPDLVLCDIMMPEMDGEELCSAIRADSEVDFLPVVMVTAKASRSSRLSALEGGADDYLVKPFDPEELRLRVGNLLAARRRLRERFREEGLALPRLEIDSAGDPGSDEFGEELKSVLLDRLGDENLDVEEIAKELHVSRATLYRKAAESLDTSPVELLWQLRLEQAAQWLRETSAAVSEVAYACGFKTVPHFTRRFGEHHGTTPAAYRDENRVARE